MSAASVARRPASGAPARRPPVRSNAGPLVALVAACALALPSSAAGQTKSWPSERPPRPLPAREVKFPPYEIRTLPNGLQVVVVQHHEQPAVSMRMLIRAGAAYDPAGKAGVANLAAALLDQGTTSKDAQKIADTIDSIGGGLGTGAGTDLSFVNVVVMKDSFDLGLDLLSDVVRNPSFAAEEIERQRQQALSGMRVSQEDPDYVASAVFDRLVYGFHPYGLPNGGTPESLQKITRDDLLAYHKKYFVPNNAIFAIVGDVTPEEAFAAAQKVLGNWTKQDVPAPRFPDPPEPTRRIVVINKPDAVQTEIRVGHLALPRKHPDYMALNLAVKVLGGEGANRLHQVLRTQRGLTYGASADLDTLKQSGDIVADTDTRSEATGEVLRLIIEEFMRIQREPVNPRELADAQAYLAGSFPLTIETPDAIATQVLNALFYDLPLQELQTFRERVNAVTPDDIQRVAIKYLKPDRLSIVLVGNVDAFTTQLRAVGFGKFEMIPLNELDLASVDFKRGGRPVSGGGPVADLVAPPASSPAGTTGNAPPAAAQPGDARDLIAKAVAAKGGLEKLRAVKTVVADAKTRVIAPQGEVNATTRTYIMYPDRFRVDATIQGVEVSQTYNAGSGWVRDPGGIRDAPDPMRDEFKTTVTRELIPLLLSVVDGAAKARMLSPAKSEDGKPLDVVEVTPAGLEPVVIYIDPSTHLISKQTYLARGPSGSDRVDEVFSDYRPVDGLQVAFKAAVKRGEITFLEREVTDFKINVPIETDLFKKPSK
jgi:zinc protease